MGEHGSGDWDQYLEPTLFGIRTSVQESTKHTPFFLMHGREARIPFEAEQAIPITSPSQLATVEERVKRLTELRDKIHPAAKVNIDNCQKKQKEQYKQRKGLQPKKIKVGDVVLRANMLKRTKKGNKTQDTWLGPYKVVTISKYGSCQLRCVETSQILQRKVNVSQLKLYPQLSRQEEQLHLDDVQPMIN